MMLALRIGLAVIGLLALVVALFSRHAPVRKAAWWTVGVVVVASVVAGLLVWATDTGITPLGR